MGMEHASDIEKILAELRAETDAGGGFTRRELQDRMGVGAPAALERIRRLVASGKCVYAGTRQVTNIAGRPAVVPVYRVCSG